MNKPTVVVITPAFNADRFLDETIFSVICQRGDFRLRYHVQDGGSSDDTVKILRKWEERLIHGNPLGGAEVDFTWQSISDTGMYDAINRGFNQVLATVEVVSTNNPMLTWINADDILLPNAIQTANEFFCKNADSQWVTGVTTLMSESGVLSNTSGSPSGFAQSALVAGKHDGRSLPFVQQEGTFFRRNLWTHVGGLSQNFRLAGDWDLWRRFAAYEELVKIRAVLAVHRRHSGQLSEDLFSYYAEVDCAEPIEAGIDLHEDAKYAIYKIDTREWQLYTSTSADLRNEMSPAPLTGGHIDFGLSELPPWVESISGMSWIEAFGRWSDANLAPSVRIVTRATLPRRFQLCLNIRALSVKENSPVTICVGTALYLVNVTDQFSKIKVDIDNFSGANVIDISPSMSVSPMDFGWAPDIRRLGLAIAELTISDLDI